LTGSQRIAAGEQVPLRPRDFDLDPPVDDVEQFLAR
jgi:hypothetical protein